MKAACPGGFPPCRLPGRWAVPARPRGAHRRSESEGVDLVEVGLPYSDPVIDGVTIQRAGTKAERGVRTRDVFAAVEAVVATYARGRDDLLELMSAMVPTGSLAFARLEERGRSPRT
jgi:tryptophan synthase alpha subunit